jgi:hypothetical protein
MGKRNENLVKHFDIDIVCNMLVEGKRWADIAESFKVPVSTLHGFISTHSEFSARVGIARKISSDSYAEMAELALLRAKSDPNEMTRARELAQHYRWMAGKRNPSTYGDKVQTEHSGVIGIQPITGMEIK